MDEKERLQGLVQRYAMLGLVSFIEEQAKLFENEHKRRPRTAIVGQLEWLAILGCEPTEDFSVAGILVIPDDTLTNGVRFV